MSFKRQQGFFRPFSRRSSLVGRIPQLFILVGLVLISIGFYNLYRAYLTYSWSTAEGLVIASGMESYTRTYTDSTTNSIRDRTVYDAYVAYQYVVDGRRYSNDDIRVGGTINSNIKAWSRRILNKYPEGKVVAVFYDPEDPAQSVLENGIYLSTFAPSFLGLVFIVFAIAMKKALGSLFQRLFGVISSRESQTILEPARFSGASDSRLLGKWKVVYQTPSYDELAAYSLKLFSSGAEPVSSNNFATPKGAMTVIISETEIQFVQVGMGDFGQPGQKYTLAGRRIVLAPIQLGMLMQAMTDMIPQYFDFTFVDSKLILTSNKIKGYDNQSIVYHLEKV